MTTYLLITIIYLASLVLFCTRSYDHGYSNGYHHGKYESGHNYGWHYEKNSVTKEDKDSVEE